MYESISIKISYSRYLLPHPGSVSAAPPTPVLMADFYLSIYNLMFKTIKHLINVASRQSNCLRMAAKWILSTESKKAKEQEQGTGTHATGALGRGGGHDNNNNGNTLEQCKGGGLSKPTDTHAHAHTHPHTHTGHDEVFSALFLYRTRRELDGRAGGRPG